MAALAYWRLPKPDLMEAVVAKKEPEAEERVFPDHRRFLLNTLIAQEPSGESLPWQPKCW